MGLPVPPADRRRPSHVDLRAIQELQRTVLEQTLADARVWRNGYTLLLTGTGAVLTLAASRLGDASWKWRLALTLALGGGILLLTVALWLVLTAEGGKHGPPRGLSLDSILTTHGSVEAYRVDQAAQAQERIRSSQRWARWGALAVFVGLMLTLWVPS